MKTESKGPHIGVMRKVPSLRERAINITIEEWLKGKETDDGAEGLWRIHDDLYDFTDFMNNHPGGKYWLEITKCTDITEAFETHHLSEKAENMLKKFHVKKAKTPRMSLITFNENGFYKTLKKKIRKANVITFVGSSWQSRFLIDNFLLGFLLTNLLATSHSYGWSVVSGAFLYMLTVAAHNFFHMKDNFRMYYFNFSLLSFRDWRVSHALSHHPYANTYLDLEITFFEPVFQYLPKPDKSVVSRYLPWVASPFIFCVIFHIEFLKRCIRLILKQKSQFCWGDFLGLTVPIVTWLLSNQDLSKVLLAWNLTLFSGSFLFFLVGLTAAHHHPEIYHEGDYLGNDKDYGIVQLAAVRDRKEINNNFFLTMITFGDHALHHMFPTLDHWKLPDLAPYLLETCKEFNVDFKLTTYGNLITGMYQQLARNYVNGKLLIKTVNHS